MKIHFKPKLEWVKIETVRVVYFVNFNKNLTKLSVANYFLLL